MGYGMWGMRHATWELGREMNDHLSGVTLQVLLIKCVKSCTLRTGTRFKN